MGVTKEISIVTVKDKLGYSNQVVISLTGILGPVTESEEEFYNFYCDAAIVRQNVVQNSKSTIVGSYYTGFIDMTDIAAFDEAGDGAASSAGALIHETVEQLEKAKLGLLPYEYSKTVGLNQVAPEFISTHHTATEAEDRVNGNERKEKKSYFQEKDGTRTRQDLKPNKDGGVTVEKHNYTPASMVNKGKKAGEPISKGHF